MKLSVFCMLILEKRLTSLIMQYCSTDFVSWEFILYLFCGCTASYITITEQIKHGEVGHLQKSLDTITGWCSGNSMRIKGRNNKEMLVSFKKTKPEFDPITHEDVPLETVDHFKLLRVWVSNNMTWKQHVEHIYAVASPRLYYLKQLRRCGVATYVL